MHNKVCRHKFVCGWYRNLLRRQDRKGSRNNTAERHRYKVSDWLEENKLLLNQKKTKMVLFGTKPKLNKVNTFIYCSRDRELSVSQSLNIWVSLSINVWHDESTWNWVMKRLGLLSRIRNSLTLRKGLLDIFQK
jgi:hypothetical protein